MLGLFSSSSVFYRQFVANRSPMTRTQKITLRKRLRKEDLVVDLIQKSGVKLPQLTEALSVPREEELSSTEKYYYMTKRNKYGYRPLSWLGHWTKVPHPRNKQENTIYHYKPKILPTQEHHRYIEGNRRIDKRFRDKHEIKIKFD